MSLLLFNIFINDLADGITSVLETPKMKPNCEWLRTLQRTRVSFKVILIMRRGGLESVR